MKSLKYIFNKKTKELGKRLIHVLQKLMRRFLNDCSIDTKIIEPKISDLRNYLRILI